MANIYVPNIIITQDYNLINKIMESDYLDVTQKFEEDKAILLSTRQNKYVYSLEHSINFNGSDSKIILKILDTDNDFENKFFNEGFMKMLMNEHVTNYLKNKEQISEFGKYFTKTLNSQIRIYIAYGVGNELSNWSNPLACTLFGANVELANNGIRTYTYEFIPEVNYFFRYQTIEADKFNPNENIGLTFGGLVTKTSVDHFVPDFDFKRVTLNVKSLLTKFISKVTNVPESNVITLIPDIDKGTYIVSSTPLKDESRVADAQGSPDTGDSLYLGASNERPAFIDLDFINFYTQNFQFTGKVNTVNVIENIIQNKYTSTFLKEDVLSEINSNIIKENEKYQKSNKELQSTINELDNKIRELTRSMFELEAVTTANPKYKDAQKQLEKVKQKRNDIINERTTTLNKKPQISKLFTETQNKLNSKKAAILGSLSPKQKNKNVKGITLTLVSTPNENKSDSPQIPDWFKTIENVFLGIAKLHGGHVTPSISYESDAKFLKLFKKYGIIKDETIPCIIIGERQMVLDYIYKNQVPISKIETFKSKFNINSEDSLYDVLNSNQYPKDLRNIVGKKKNNSSFSEDIILDELAINDITGAIKELTAVDDIPIFLNNFKNSNVLSYSVKNTENYMTATRMGVLQNRYKTLLSQLDNDILSKVLESGGLTETDNLSPVDIARTLFSDSVGLLEKENLKNYAQEKLSSNVLDIFKTIEELDEMLTPEGSLVFDSRASGRQAILTNIDKYSDPKFKIPVKAFMGGYREEPSEKFTEKAKNLKKAFESLNDQDKKIVNFLNSIREQSRSKPIIFSNSQENITLMNALLQTKLSENEDGNFKYGRKSQNLNERGIRNEDLLPLAEAIILINAANLSSGNSQVDITPGKYLPNQNFILGKITEYAMKYFVEVSLKTLPFFYLSNYRVIAQPAFFYSKKINVSNYLNFNSIDFFSGEYRIMGFRHVINTKECYSEFLLTKAGALSDNLKKVNG